MPSNEQFPVKFFLIGLGAGLFLLTAAWFLQRPILETVHNLRQHKQIFAQTFQRRSSDVVENFNEPIAAAPGRRFGKKEALTFELFREGTFLIDGASGYALQRSAKYEDSAWIRSSEPLPKTYTISAVVGYIDYALANIENLENDPRYPEGPKNENGCYLLSITDMIPEGHHTNIWWHQHRKLVIDVDNNIWGHGAPNPIFMVYFNRQNELRALSADTGDWSKDWVKGVTYHPQAWYRVEVKKTSKYFRLRVYDAHDKLIKEGTTLHSDVYNADAPEYLVIGDPHENYYQGSFRIKEITIGK